MVRSNNISICIMSIFVTLLIVQLTGCADFKLVSGALYERVDNPNYHPLGSGDYKDDVKDGMGEVRYSNGDYYIGGLKNGHYHGKGELFLTDQLLVGEFANNEIIQGEIRFNNGQVYKGRFRNGKKHGRGTYTWPDGDRYEGGFFLDQRHGEGLLIRADGSHCKRTYKKDQLIKNCS